MTTESKTMETPENSAEVGIAVHALVRLRGQVEMLRTDQNQIPAHEPMGWDESCLRVLALIDEANADCPVSGEAD